MRLRNVLRALALGTAKRAMKYAGIPLRDPALVAIFGRNEVTSGVDVNEDTALNFSACYSAVNLISSTVGMMPCRLVEKEPQEGKVNPALAKMLPNVIVSQTPNRYATPLVFHQTHQAHALTHGNSYMEIVRQSGVPVALRTLLPDQVNPHFNDKEELEYELNERDDVTKKNRILPPEDVIHIPGLGYDGTQGYSVIQYAREAVGLGIAAERYGAGFFGRGAIPSGVLSHPGDLSPEAEERLREDFEKRHRNAENGSRVAVLDEGMKYTPIGIPPEDAQFLQTRQFQVVEIARWFRVPPFMLYEAVQATFANTEQQGKDFLTYTLLPWLIKWQQEYNRKLLTVEEQEKYSFAHDARILLMPDMATRYAAYSVGVNGGWLTLNDIQRWEGMPSLPASVGDVRRVPSTMKTLGEADPTTPIDVKVMADATAYLASLGVVTTDAARNVLNAAMPTASDKLVSSIIDTLKKANKVA